MNQTSRKLKKIVVAGGALFAALAVPMVVGHVTGLNMGIVSSA
jgi:hypothetical protein